MIGFDSRKFVSVALPCAFLPNGAVTTLTNANYVGVIQSVVRSNTGVFDVTLSTTAPEFLSIQVSKQFTTQLGTTGVSVEVASSSATAGTIQLRTMNTGTTTLVDIAAAAGNIIHLVAWVPA